MWSSVDWAHVVYMWCSISCMSWPVNLLHEAYIKKGFRVCTSRCMETMGQTAQTMSSEWYQPLATSEGQANTFHLEFQEHLHAPCKIHKAPGMQRQPMMVQCHPQPPSRPHEWRMHKKAICLARRPTCLLLLPSSQKQLVHVCAWGALGPYLGGTPHGLRHARAVGHQCARCAFQSPSSFECYWHGSPVATSQDNALHCRLATGGTRRRARHEAGSWGVQVH